MSSGFRVELVGITGLPEIRPGDDLADMIARHADRALVDGQIVVVTSKVVSKAAGLASTARRADLVAAHTDRVVAVRGETHIVRTRSGLTLAAAGLDDSNSPVATVLALPEDPDREAVTLRRRLRERTGANVAVVVTDTAGRPWRLGQTDLAIGVAGLAPLHDLAGRRDPYGNVLAVTAPAVADEIAGAADLVQGKLERIPVAVLTGLAHLVLAPHDDGPGAVALVRAEDEDLFGFGALDAVRAVVRRDDPDRHRGFPLPRLPVADLVSDALQDNAAVTVAAVAGTAAEESRSVWDVAASDISTAVDALWGAATLVERLRVLAAATRREVRVTRADGSVLARVEILDAADMGRVTRTLSGPT